MDGTKLSRARRGPDPNVARHLIIASSEPVAGREDEYHRWYDNQHVGDVLAVAGFVRAQRFRAVPSLRGQLPDRRFLALYEIETEDFPATLDSLADALSGMDLSSAVDWSSTSSFAYRELASAQESAAAPRAQGRRRRPPAGGLTTARPVPRRRGPQNGSGRAGRGTAGR